MTQKPGKGDFAPRGACPQTSLEVGNRSVFILDPHLVFKTRKSSKKLKMVCTVQIVEKESYNGIWIPESKKFLLVSTGNSMIRSDIWHKYHE